MLVPVRWVTSNEFTTWSCNYPHAFGMAVALAYAMEEATLGQEDRCTSLLEIAAHIPSVKDAKHKALADIDA